MPHEDELDDLRVGGWFQEPRPTSALVPYRSRLPIRHEETSEKARRVLLACGVAVVVGVAGLMAVVVTADVDGQAGENQQLAFPTLEPLTPISLLPAPASSSPTPAGAVPTNTQTVAERTTRQPTSRSKAAARASSRSSSPSPSRVSSTGLTAGKRVGLGVAGNSGLLVRHRNFVARAERITSSSSDLDKADSTFVVRTGLGRSSCFSFESANYPGYYLRHRDFVLRLERRDGSQLFGQDATFCPSATSDGFYLESINYPNRALHLRSDDVVHLDQGTGTAFVVKSALS